jgi:hypothetical protein
MSVGNERAGRGWLGWVLLPTILVVGVGLVCAVSAKLVRSQEIAGSASPSPSVTVGTTADAARPESAKEKVERLQGQVNSVLGEQVAALLRQDEAAFLRPAKDPAVREKLLLRYRNLVGLRVSRITMTVNYLSMDTTAGRWQAEVSVSFCFVQPDCVLDKVSEPSMWAETPDGPELVSIEPAKPPSGWFGEPQPWEMTDLVVAHGNRVLVAAPRSLAGRLAAVLDAAEQAVPLADSYAIGPPPDQYRVYLADGTAWKTWYGRVPPNWAAGYANAIGATHSDIVLNNSHSRASFLPELLRHELTHAATVQGSHGWVGNWWLIEGIADVAAGDTAVGSDARRFIRSGWDRKFPATGPPDDASLTYANRLYKIAALAVKCLQDRFGRERLLTFFERVVEFGDTYTRASTTAFDAPWAEVETGCIAAIRAS